MSRFVSCLLAWVSSAGLTGCATGGPVMGPTVTGRQALEHYALNTDSATNGCLRNPACYAQTGDEAVIPWLSRAAEAARTGTVVMQFLADMDVKRVEKVLVDCAKDADFQVNEKEFGKGNVPTPEQCKEVIGRENGKDVTRAMVLGTQKHKQALDCVKKGLDENLLRNVTTQPHYKYDPAAGRWLMLDPKLVARWVEDQLFDLLLGTLAPDIVIHDSGNPNKVQRIYDYKFPCLSSRKEMPRWRYSKEQRSDQGARYADALGGDEKPRLITPQLGLQ